MFSLVDYYPESLLVLFQNFTDDVYYPVTIKLRSIYSLNEHPVIFYVYTFEVDTTNIESSYL